MLPDVTDIVLKGLILSLVILQFKVGDTAKCSRLTVHLLKWFMVDFTDFSNICLTFLLKTPAIK